MITTYTNSIHPRIKLKTTAALFMFGLVNIDCENDLSVTYADDVGLTNRFPLPFGLECYYVRHCIKSNEID